MEQYRVRFWVTNEKGYREQTSEMVYGKNKKSHKFVENFIRKKHKIKKEDVIGVYYQ